MHLMQTVVCGADVESLVTYERSCAAADEAMLVASRRLRKRLDDFAGSSPDSMGVGCALHPNDLERFARGTLAHDRWVGRVGRNFSEADSGRFEFDSLTDTGFVAAARELVAGAGWDDPPGAQEVDARSDRLVAAGEIDLAEELRSEPWHNRRGWFSGIAEGLTDGGFEDRPWVDAQGELGELVGSVAAGLLVYGDVRDGIAAAKRGDWFDAGLNLAGTVPLLGDALKIGAAVGTAGVIAKKAADLAGAARAARRLTHAVSKLDHRLAVRRAKRGDIRRLPGHPGDPTIEAHAFDHVVPDEAALWTRLDAEGKDVVSGFLTAPELKAAVDLVLTRRRAQIEEWLASGNGILRVEHPFKEVGLVATQGSIRANPGRRVELVLMKRKKSIGGYYVKTVKTYAS